MKNDGWRYVSFKSGRRRIGREIKSMMKIILLRSLENDRKEDMKNDGWKIFRNIGSGS